ncbi:MAG: 26S proteasome non-ATPase regulatory subunit 2 [Marteilia pararefringens]
MTANGEVAVDSSLPKLQESELSEKDQKLKNEIDSIFQNIKDSNITDAENALKNLSEIINSASIIMSSVPKTFKFIKPYFEELKQMENKAISDLHKKELSGMISILSVIMGKTGDTLEYFMKSKCPLGEKFSLEFVHHLVHDIISEHQTKMYSNEFLGSDVLDTVSHIVRYQLSHNSEIDACDFLLEIDRLELLKGFVDDENIEKISEYLDRCSSLVADEEAYNILNIIVDLNLILKNFPMALHAALRLNSYDLILVVLKACNEKATLYQLLLMLSNLQIDVDLENNNLNHTDDNIGEIYSNEKKYLVFQESAKTVGIDAPKSLEDIFKKKLVFPKKSDSDNLILDRKYLSLSVINNFLNCAFGTDKIFTTSDCMNWINNLGEFALNSSIASIGYLYLWNIEDGLNFVNQFIVSEQPKIKAGGILAAGIIGTSIRDDFNSILALLGNETDNEDIDCRISAILGLAISYAGSNNTEILNLIYPHLYFSDSKINNKEVICVAALSVGLICVGSANSIASSYLIKLMIDSSLNDFHERDHQIMSLALGLIFMRKVKYCQTIMDSLSPVQEPLRSTTKLMVNILCHAGSGNVEIILDLMRVCLGSEDVRSKNPKSNEILHKKDEDSPQQEDIKDQAADSDKEANSDLSVKFVSLKNKSLAVIGMAIVAMGEKVGSEMIIRLFTQLTRYGDYVVKGAVPLALALLNLSNPTMGILQMLTKLTHDSDHTISYAAMLSLGLVSAGTNNAKYAQTLKSMKNTSAAHRDSMISFVLNISLGLCYMGKGSLTLSPFRHCGLLLKMTSLASTISFCILALHADDFIYGKNNYMMHILAPAISSKFLNTYEMKDDKLVKTSVSLRVGNELDTIASAGKPRKVTGFQTHKTPVSVNRDERAELVDEDFASMTPFLEGSVILKTKSDENPSN